MSYQLTAVGVQRSVGIRCAFYRCVADEVGLERWRYHAARLILKVWTPYESARQARKGLEALQNEP